MNAPTQQARSTERSLNPSGRTAARLRVAGESPSQPLDLSATVPPLVSGSPDPCLPGTSCERTPEKLYEEPTQLVA